MYRNPNSNLHTCTTSTFLLELSLKILAFSFKLYIFSEWYKDWFNDLEAMLIGCLVINWFTVTNEPCIITINVKREEERNLIAEINWERKKELCWNGGIGRMVNDQVHFDITRPRENTVEWCACTTFMRLIWNATILPLFLCEWRWLMNSMWLIMFLYR